MLYVAEKTLRENQNGPQDLRHAVELKIEALKGIRENADSEALRRATSELSYAVQNLGAAMYEQTGSTPPPQSTAADEDVVEGEVS
jgi:hypothetical protein